ncbi:polymer-forming cytoskeletal protein [Chloracidobacterium thermophilum]|uniref:bactofilin family protein n=1 Tax=Chloracidobacterium thermophilum TaxID=458033 RepID=UPI0007385BA6|nr:polymer-forming cytoskeletal protein [Chloracidobacterium thermophilum]
MAEKLTIVEEGSELTGTLKSTCGVTVSGKVSGELHAPALVVATTGAVHGTVKVEKLHSQGELSGRIDADTIELSGRINDQTTITARSLEVKSSNGEQPTALFGNCVIEVGVDPNEPALPTAPPAREGKGKKGQPTPEPTGE